MKLEEFSKELKKVPMTGAFVNQIDLLKSRYGEEYTELAEDILNAFDVLGLDAVKTARRYIFDYP